LQNPAPPPPVRLGKDREAGDVVDIVAEFHRQPGGPCRPVCRQSQVEYAIRTRWAARVRCPLVFWRITQRCREDTAGCMPASHVARAKSLLAVADGASYEAAARAAGRCSNDAVAQLVSRFNKKGLAALETPMAVGRQSSMGQRSENASWPSSSGSLTGKWTRSVRRLASLPSQRPSQRPLSHSSIRSRYPGA